MFFDSGAWPPPPGGFDPPPRRAPRLSPAQERRVMRVIGLFLLTLFLGPLAGSSVVAAAIALVRAVHG